MTGVTRSMQAWLIYTVAIGATLLLVPNTILGVFQIEEATEVWVRVAGGLVLVLAIMYWFIIAEQSRSMFQATVYGRGFIAVVLAVLAFTAGPWQLVLFAAGDAAGALWTHLANRRTTE
jgi:hypothetical protein